MTPIRLLAAGVPLLTTLAAAAPVATIDGAPIDREALVEPLIESYGLELLLNLAQLEAAKAEARAAGVTVTPDDVARERALTAEYLATQTTGGEADQDPQELLDLYLRQQEISPAAFDIVLAINAHLRALSRPQLDEALTDDVLRRAFNLQYGEKIVVRHIALPNLEAVAEAQRRIAGGEDFASVARDMSTFERTAVEGGLMPAFSRQQLNLPEAFKEVAFGLVPGEVSSPVQADGSFHLVKLLERQPPGAVKFEDVRDDVRRQVELGAVRSIMNQKRAEIQQKVLRDLQIENPALRRQFEAAKAAQEPQPLDDQALEQRFQEQRDELGEGREGGGDE